MSQPTLQFRPEGLSPTFVLMFVFFFWGGAFQIGYFDSIGIEFLSFAEPIDWLFTSDLLTGVVFVLYFVILSLVKHLKYAIENNNLEDSRIWKLATTIDNLPYYILFPLLIITVIYSSNLLVIVRLVFIGVLFVFCCALLIALINIHLINGQILLKDLGRLLTMGGMLIYAIVNIYDQYIAGNKCDVFTTNGNFFDVYYLRTVSGGIYFALMTELYISVVGM